MRLSHLLFAALLISSTQAQVPAPDPTFGGDGFVVTDLGLDSHDMANAMVLQPDGKVVVVGSSNANCAAVVRYLSDGSLDASFGTNGWLGVPNSVAMDVALQPDGKIVVAGNVLGALALFRFLSDGTLDPDFSTDGVASFPIAQEHANGNSVLVLANGDLLLAGTSLSDVDGLERTKWLRTSADGTLDTGLGDAGIVTEQSVALGDEGVDIAVDAVGRILLARNVDDATRITITRYLSDGTPDASFGNGGTAEGVNWCISYSHGLAVQPDGKILLGTTTGSFAVTRFTADGLLDTDFGTDGQTTVWPAISWEGPEECKALVLQPDGKILLAGTSSDNTIGAFMALVRLDTDGQPDASFGTDGIYLVPQTSVEGDYANCAIQQPDGKILVAGFSGTADRNFEVVRLNNDLSTTVTDASLITSNATLQPNPATDRVTLTWSSNAASSTECELFDVSGKNMRTFFSGAQRSAGPQQDELNIAGLAPGVYTVMLTSGDERTRLRFVKQ